MQTWLKHLKGKSHDIGDSLWWFWDQRFLFYHAEQQNKQETIEVHKYRQSAEQTINNTGKYRFVAEQTINNIGKYRHTEEQTINNR